MSNKADLDQKWPANAVLIYHPSGGKLLLIERCFKYDVMLNLM